MSCRMGCTRLKCNAWVIAVLFLALLYDQRAGLCVQFVLFLALLYDQRAGLCVPVCTSHG
jgi:hypothetical protein